MRMNIKNTLTVILTLFVVLGLVFTLVFYVASYNKSANNHNIQIHTVSGNSDVMKDINLVGEISSWEFVKYDNMDVSNIEFTVDAQGNLQTKNTKYYEKTYDYNAITNPTSFDVNFNVIIPKDAKTEMLYKEEENDDGYLGRYSADKFIPCYKFASNNTYYDTFLIVQPNYYVDCTSETKLIYNHFDYDNKEFDTYEDGIFIVEKPVLGEFDTELLTAKIDNYYYMVLPTLDNAVGTNGIYKFTKSEERLSVLNEDYIEGQSHSHEDFVAENEYRYEKLIDIPINVEDESNKVVSKIFEYNGDLVLISTQKISEETDRIYLSVYDIQSNRFTKEEILGEFSSDTSFYNNDDYLTIQSDLSFVTYDLSRNQFVNESKLEEPVMAMSVLYSDDKLYLFNLVFDEDCNDNKAYMYMDYANEILVYQCNEQLYKGELHTDVYQDYMNVTGVNARKIANVNFARKEK